MVYPAGPIKYGVSNLLNLLLTISLAAQPAAAPAADASAAPRPLNRGEWIRTEDYPPAALRNWEQGNVSISVTVAPDGIVSDCTVTASTATPLLDEATCFLVRSRAAFEPARDMAGAAVAAPYSTRVSWRIPGKPGFFAGAVGPFEAGQLQVTYALERTKPVACTATAEGSGFHHLREEACELEVPEDFLTEIRHYRQLPIRMVVRVVLTPNGTPRPSAPPANWRLNIATAADIEVAANGFVTNCRMVGSPQVLPGIETLCDAFRVPLQTFPALTGNAVRRARITRELWEVAPPR